MTAMMGPMKSLIEIIQSVVAVIIAVTFSLIVGLVYLWPVVVIVLLIAIMERQ